MSKSKNVYVNSREELRDYFDDQVRLIALLEEQVQQFLGRLEDVKDDLETFAQQIEDNESRNKLAKLIEESESIAYLQDIFEEIQNSVDDIDNNENHLHAVTVTKVSSKGKKKVCNNECGGCKA